MRSRGDWDERAREPPGRVPASAAGRPRMTRSARRVPSCSTRRARCSAPAATTPRPWTRSPSAPGSASRCSTSTSPASSTCTGRWCRARADDMVRTVRAAIRSTTDNKARVQATIQAYFDVVSARDGAMRLVFETDTRGDARGRGAGRPGHVGLHRRRHRGRHQRRRARARAGAPAAVGLVGLLDHRGALLAGRGPAAAARGRDHADVPARLAGHRRVPRQEG